MKIRIRLEGAGDHFFTSDSDYPEEGPANVHEFLGYMRANYPDVDIVLMDPDFDTEAYKNFAACACGYYGPKEAHAAPPEVECKWAAES